MGDTVFGAMMALAVVILVLIVFIYKLPDASIAALTPVAAPAVADSTKPACLDNAKSLVGNWQNKEGIKTDVTIAVNPAGGYTFAMKAGPMERPPIPVVVGCDGSVGIQPPGAAVVMLEVISKDQFKLPGQHGGADTMLYRL